MYSILRRQKYDFNAVFVHKKRGANPIAPLFRIFSVSHYFRITGIVATPLAVNTLAK